MNLFSSTRNKEYIAVSSNDNTTSSPEIHKIKDLESESNCNLNINNSVTVIGASLSPNYNNLDSINCESTQEKLNLNHIQTVAEAEDTEDSHNQIQSLNWIKLTDSNSKRASPNSSNDSSNINSNTASSNSLSSDSADMTSSGAGPAAAQSRNAAKFGNIGNPNHHIIHSSQGSSSQDSGASLSQNNMMSNLSSESNLQHGLNQYQLSPSDDSNNYNQSYNNQQQNARIYKDNPKYMVYASSILVAGVVLLSADQNVAAPHLQQMANDFFKAECQAKYPGNDPIDIQAQDKCLQTLKLQKLGGESQFGFFILGGIATLYIGSLADVWQRVTLLVTVILIGSLPCLLTFLIPNEIIGFHTFMAQRILTGISVGGSYPLIYSLLGDMFPSDKKMMIGTIVATGTAAGVGAGTFISGLIGPYLGWRMVFCVIALPSVMTTFLMITTISEPPRCTMNGMSKRESMVLRQQQQQLQYYQQQYYKNQSQMSDPNSGIQANLGSTQAAGVGPPSSHGAGIQAFQGTVQANLNQNETSKINQIQHGSTNSYSSPQDHVGFAELDDFAGNQESSQQAAASSGVLGVVTPGQQTVTADDSKTRLNSYRDTSKKGVMKKLPRRLYQACFANATTTLCLCQAIPGCVPWATIQIFILDYMHHDLHISIQEATYVIGVFMVSGAICVLLASFYATYLSQKSPRYLAFLAALPLLVVWLSFRLLLSLDAESTPESIRLLVASFAGVGAVTGPTIKGLLLSVNGSGQRGTVFGIMTLTDDLGKGCAPILISYLMTTIGKGEAIGYAMNCFVFSSVMILFTYFYIENDIIIEAPEIVDASIAADELDDRASLTQRSQAHQTTQNQQFRKLDDML